MKLGQTVRLYAVIIDGEKVASMHPDYAAVFYLKPDAVEFAERLAPHLDKPVTGRRVRVCIDLDKPRKPTP